VTYPAAAIYAGSTVTADYLDAIAGPVAAATCTTETNNTSEAIVATVVIPASDPGLVANGAYRLDVSGTATWTGTPTCTFRVRLSSATGALLGSCGSITTQDNGTNSPWWLDAELIILSGAATCNAAVTLRSYLASATMAANMGGTEGVSVTTSGAVTIVVTTEWGSANGAVTANAGIIGRL
jgi:hypothetical protein